MAAFSAHAPPAPAEPSATAHAASPAGSPAAAHAASLEHAANATAFRPGEPPTQQQAPANASQAPLTPEQPHTSASHAAAAAARRRRRALLADPRPGQPLALEGGGTGAGGDGGSWWSSLRCDAWEETPTVVVQRDTFANFFHDSAPPRPTPPRALRVQACASTAVAKRAGQCVRRHAERPR
jgi:hypothetical protein